MRSVLVAAFAIAVSSAGLAGATTINDDFAGYAPATVLNSPDSLFGGGWKTTDGTVDYLVSGSAFGPLCRGDAACVDLDGSTGNAGVFSTASLIDPGSYLLSFLLYGSGRGTTEQVTVSLGDYLSTFTIGSDGAQEVINALVMVGAGGSALSFSNAGGDNIGALLSRASLTPHATSAIPLPASLPLLLGALAAFAAIRRRA